jgi:hypothetical protein
VRRVVTDVVRRTVENHLELGEDFVAETVLRLAEPETFYFGRQISTLQ